MRVLLLMMGCSLIYDGSDLRGKNAARPKWTAPMTFPAGNSVTNIAVGDLDGDGKPEIVAADNGDNKLSLFLNDGTGTFSPGADVATCTGPVALAIGNFDASGGVAVLCSDDNFDPPRQAGRLHSGFSNGSFATMNMFTPGGNVPKVMHAADIDADGKLDLVAVFETSKTAVTMFGDGAGGFAVNNPVSVAAGPQDLVIADLDGDGAPDIATVSYADPAVTVLLGGGTGRYPLAGGSFGITAGDFDGKNGRDLAVVDQQAEVLEILLDNGGGKFPASLPAATPIPFYPSHLRAADVDGDGRVDLIVPDDDGDNLSIYYGKGNGTFEEPVVIPAIAASDIEVVDVDGDHKPDIVLGSYLENSVAVILSR